MTIKSRLENFLYILAQRYSIPNQSQNKTNENFYFKNVETIFVLT